ncbi:MAG: hypothetical protein KIT80_23635 [Chitinophagaceae bacterium]|nr:hypothetical protein [Nitrosomonas sp.]MCW5929933.1 hypothetical protein [Chitinophagaceae bacterium]
MTEKTVNCCKQCDDGYGYCIYPYYGTAPHKCYWKEGDGETLGILGGSKELPKSEWPENFIPETEENPGGYPGTGVYTHCLNCGNGDKEFRLIK